MATERMGMGPLEIVSGYNRIKVMVNAIAALTNESEREIVDAYIRHLNLSEHEVSPEAYAREIKERVLTSRSGSRRRRAQSAADNTPGAWNDAIRRMHEEAMATEMVGRPAPERGQQEGGGG
jgi:hypothetical protein